MTAPATAPALPPVAPSAPTGPGPADPGPWSEPWSRLRELDRLLQGAGLPTGADRWQNAHDLLAALAAGHRLPTDPRQVRPLLAPLFCRSPDEQRRFNEVFKEWLGQAGTSPTGVAPLPVQRAPRPRKPPPQTQLRPILLVLALTLELFLWLKPAPTPVGDWLLPTLPGLALLAWLLWRALRRRDVLRYRKGDPDSPLRHLTLAAEDDDLFTDPALRSALRRLHTAVPVPTRRLDERATCERTARNQGLFAPVYRAPPRVPDLVVLVDFQHRADHLAGLAETLVLRLREAGLEVHRYPFQRHPARVLGARGQGIGLAELAARHAEARLLIVGDPAAFVDPWGGRAADWTEVLALWPRRALLTTQGVPDPWRVALEGAGLALAPFGEAGLIRLAGHLTQTPVAGGLPEPTLPGLLGTNTVALDPAPDAADRQALLADLDAWLGPHGGLLLAAAAVYPEVHPGLTRVLDQALFPPDLAATRAQRLLRLARLPWLRAGHLPDWLRLALTERTERGQTRRIGAIYRELLSRASVDGEDALRLPFAASGPRGSALARLRTLVRERGWRLERWIRDLAAVAGSEAPLQDRIFLDTVLRPRLLDFLLPRRLACLLPRRPGRLRGLLTPKVSGGLTLSEQTPRGPGNEKFPVREGEISLGLPTLYVLNPPKLDDVYRPPLPDEKASTFYLVVFRFTLAPGPSERRYETMRFKVALSDPRITAVKLMPERVLAESDVNEEFDLGFTIDLPNDTSEAPATAESKMQTIRFSRLIPDITSFGSGESQFFWKFSGHDNQPLAPGARTVAAVIQVPNSAKHLSAKISWDIDLERSRFEKWLNVTTKIEAPPVELPFF